MLRIIVNKRSKIAGFVFFSLFVCLFLLVFKRAKAVSYNVNGLGSDLQTGKLHMPVRKVNVDSMLLSLADGSIKSKNNHLKAQRSFQG